MKKNYLTWILGLCVVILSMISLFVGVLDVDIHSLLINDMQAWQVFLASRIPRLLAIICTGAGMSIAGALMQQLCMNKFVSPSTSATLVSAQLGMLISLVFFPTSTLFSQAGMAFIFAIMGTWIFVSFVLRMRFKDIIMVPLIGIMFSNIIGGITNYLAHQFELTQSLSSWMSGHFSYILQGRYEIVFLVVPLIIIAFVFSNYFNLVGMGEDFAKNLGIPYAFVLFIGISISAMISASIVVVVGSISYIGLIIPNVVSIFKGDKLKGTLVDIALCGILFVLICDMISRIIIFPYELSIEMVIGVIGSILFIGLLIYRLNYGR